MYILLLALLFFPTFALAQFSIDSPLPGSVQSGTVAPPTGWRCTAGVITASIDDGPAIGFTEQQNRGDTAGPCSNTGDNAFIIAQPWNWNLFGDGLHTITFSDNGTQFASVTFEVVTFGTEFLLDQSASCIIPNFPDPGADVEVSWDQAIQNFRITEVIEDEGDGNIPNVAGAYTTALDFVAEDCSSLVPVDFPPTLNASIEFSQNGSNVSAIAGLSTLQGDVHANGDFSVSDIPLITTLSNCVFATGATFSGNFFDNSLAFRISQTHISGACFGLTLPCSVEYEGTITAGKASVGEEGWTPERLIEQMQRRTIQ
jgi:hypothetical protein